MDDMLRLRLNLLIILLACGISHLCAQVDTTVMMEELVIQAKSIRQSTVGSEQQIWRSSEIDQGEADIPLLLQSEAGVYIKGYGLGSLATSSIRGGSAGHTLVLWNGLPLQSPMLGLLDLSLLSAQSFEEIGLEKGGQSALWGSGAIGGVLSLNNQQAQEGFSIKLHAGIGSFAQQKQEASVGFSLGKLYFQTKVNREAAENDFTYSISEDLPLRQQSNAQLDKLNILQDVYVQFNERNYVVVHYWHQSVERQIPPTTVQTSSQAFQEDESDRILIDWKRFAENNSLNLKLAAVNEELNYFDPAINLESPSRFKNYFAEVNHETHFQNSHKLVFGVSHQYTEAEATGYQENIEENKSALFGSYKWSYKTVNVQGSLRQENVDGEFVPFIPAIGFSFELSEEWQWRGKMSRNYRLPTLNDRFWRPGGNVELMPESGWSQEMSLHLKHVEDVHEWDASVTGFTRKIDDWILWAVLEGQASFSAHNISKVWSRGIESRVSYETSIPKATIKINAGYDFIKSTNERSIEQPKLTKGQQLIYTPIHQGFMSAQMNWKSFVLQYNHQAVGKAGGFNEDIDAYHVGNIRLQLNQTFFDKKRIKTSGEIYLNIHNLWNADYRVIERRAMPSRYFLTGIKLNISK